MAWSSLFGMLWLVLDVNVDQSLRFVRVHGTDVQNTENHCQSSSSQPPMYLPMVC